MLSHMNVHLLNIAKTMLALQSKVKMRPAQPTRTACLDSARGSASLLPILPPALTNKTAFPLTTVKIVFVSSASAPVPATANFRTASKECSARGTSA